MWIEFNFTHKCQTAEMHAARCSYETMQWRRWAEEWGRRQTHGHAIKPEREWMRCMGCCFFPCSRTQRATETRSFLLPSVEINEDWEYMHTIALASILSVAELLLVHHIGRTASTSIASNMCARRENECKTLNEQVNNNRQPKNENQTNPTTTTKQ